MASVTSSPEAGIKHFVRELYGKETSRGVGFRYGLLVFDLVTIAYLILTSFDEESPWIAWIDPVIGLLIAADFAARLWISDRKLKDITSPLGLVDIAVIASLLIPIRGWGFAFMRVLRTLRLLRSYTVVRRLRWQFAFFRRNEQTIDAALNLVIFMFVTTSVVYETQRNVNDKIDNYVDALYFTVTTLTTTGYGDITLKGTWGELLSVAVMIFGVSLFLRLVQLIMRPAKVVYRCRQCGLKRHDYDAVHCKACGAILNIEDEGAT